MRSDSITIQAQTQRSRSANADDNHEKLVGELHRIYQEQVPAATDGKKIKKHEAM
jgi:peptidyl-tRNA hydrolase ICT1